MKLEGKQHQGKIKTPFRQAPKETNENVQESQPPSSAEYKEETSLSSAIKTFTPMLMNKLPGIKVIPNYEKLAEAGLELTGS